MRESVVVPPSLSKHLITARTIKMAWIYIRICFVVVVGWFFFYLFFIQLSHACLCACIYFRDLLPEFVFIKRLFRRRFFGVTWLETGRLIDPHVHMKKLVYFFNPFHVAGPTQLLKHTEMSQNNPIYKISKIYFTSTLNYRQKKFALLTLLVPSLGLKSCSFLINQISN